MMGDPSTFHLVAAGLYFAPVLVWSVLAHFHWTFLRPRRPAMQIYRILPAISTVVAFHFLIIMLTHLAQPQFEGHFTHRLLVALRTLGAVALGPLGRHMALAIAGTPFSDEQRSQAWLAANYGSGVLVGAALLPAALLAAPNTSAAWMVSRVIPGAYLLLMVVLAGWEMRGCVRSGRLRLASLLGHFHRVDVVVASIVAGLALGLGIAEGISGGDATLGHHATAAGLGVLAGVPFALRGLAMVVRRAVLAATTLGIVAGVYFAAHAATASVDSATARRFVDLAAVVGLALMLMGGRRAIDRALFRRSRVREELHAFLQTLSPDLGVLECCRRALAEVTRRVQLPGAAILLARDGSAITHGRLHVESLRRAWPTGAAANQLPVRTFFGLWLRDPQLREALIEADVVAVVPILSPRRLWGHLFVSRGSLWWLSFGEEDLETLDRFADQLALVLDGADLLAHAVAVERSLAHAEKLAAIGELAARIAHEIRNPVTAARSLAQQLAREPTSPLNAEHSELILTELERVEGQIGALLRFARRESFHFVAVDLGDLVRMTVEELFPRLEAAGIAVKLDLHGALTARADREKLRQAIINIIENALDALGECPLPRRLAVSLTAADGVARLRFTDSGPGVPADALPHLFEPFFSLKTSGTGLGLAIAKRTVDAHGGHMTAVSPAGQAGTGLMLQIELPLDAEV